MLYLGLSQGYGVIYPGRLSGGGKGKLSRGGKGDTYNRVPSSGRNPILRQDRSCPGTDVTPGQLPPQHSSSVCVAGAEPSTFLGSTGDGEVAGRLVG